MSPEKVILTSVLKPNTSIITALLRCGWYRQFMLFLFRCVALSLYFVIITVAGITVCFFRPFNPDNNRVIATMFSSFGLKILGLKVEVKNAERLIDLEPSVIVSNHQSNLDLFVLGGIVPKRTASVGKKSLKWIPVFGQLYWLAGNVLIDRTNARQSIGAMNETTQAIQEGHSSIWIFPEGTRNMGRGLGRFKKGAFHIAVQAQCPIYPIAAATYPGRIKLNQWHSGTVTINILPPVNVAGLAEKDVDDLVHKVHLLIADEIGRLDSLRPTPVDE